MKNGWLFPHRRRARSRLHMYLDSLQLSLLEGREVPLNVIDVEET